MIVGQASLTDTALWNAVMIDKEIILNFHGIGKPHAQVGPDEIPYWIGEDFFDDILVLAKSHRNSRMVVFTFDDGNRSDLTIAAERLQSRGLTGKFYVLASRLGSPHYLSRDDARCLCEAGMEIGLHGRDHVDWRTVAPARLADETIAAKQEISAAIGRAVDSVAIPFGAYNARVIRHLRACQFERIYTSDGGVASARNQIRNRTSIRSNMGIADVLAILDEHEATTTRARRLVSTTLRRYLV